MIIQGNPIHDIDKLPIPDYESFDMDYYCPTYTEKHMKRHAFYNREEMYERFGKKLGWKAFHIYSGRGCYGKCTFCGAAGIGRRNHSPKYVVDHMEHLQTYYGVEIFTFQESLTLSTRAWVVEFCKEILRRNMKCLYLAQCRADFQYDDEVLQLLKKSGCCVVMIGFESADQKVLDIMGKKISVKRYGEAAEAFHKHRITVVGSFILNMPGETKESLKKIVDFVKKYKLTKTNPGYASPYPATELFEYAKKHGFIKSVKDIIYENPSKNKGRNDFDLYFKRYNFNNLNPKLLKNTMAAIRRWDRINYFYYRNKLTYKILCFLPFFVDLEFFVIKVKLFIRFHKTPMRILRRVFR